MGMYDNVIIEIECPYCGEKSEMDAQTKELDCNLDVWKKGDYVTDKLNYLDCIADCRSIICKKFQVGVNGYDGGWGRLFYVKILLTDGRVNGDYEITNPSK